MSKKIPSQFTGRFSIKPKKTSSTSKSLASASSSQEPESASLSAPEPVSPEAGSLVEKLREEPTPFHLRKRKMSGESEADNEMAESRGLSGSLDKYSQQLEIEQAGILGEPSEQRARMRLSVGTLPNPGDPHTFQEDALTILKTGWQSANDIKGTARVLANRATSVPDADTLLLFLRCIVRAIREYASDQAQAIDFMLLAYTQAVMLLPKSFLARHGRGPDATLTQLKWLLVDEVNGFDGALLSTSTAAIDTQDRSNLKIRHSQVSKNLPEVLDQIHDWRFQRKMWFIAAAIQSRCFALEILLERNGEHIESLIDAGLNRRSSRWSKANMLGACILLRGCAKSLNARVPTSGIKVHAWKAALDNFLLQDDETWDNDFVIKAHAALALSNLTDGPIDETSEQLFAPGNWIF